MNAFGDVAQSNGRAAFHSNDHFVNMLNDLDNKVELGLAGLTLAVGPGFAQLVHEGCHSTGMPQHQPDCEPSPEKFSRCVSRCVPVFDMTLDD